jgi:hypothetical protein
LIASDLPDDNMASIIPSAIPEEDEIVVQPQMQTIAKL